jgi:hypothetical protein
MCATTLCLSLTLASPSLISTRLLKSASSKCAIIFIASIKEYRYVRWNDNKANGKFTTAEAHKKRKAISLEWRKFVIEIFLIICLCTIRKNMKKCLITIGRSFLLYCSCRYKTHANTKKATMSEFEPKTSFEAFTIIEFNRYFCLWHFVLRDLSFSCKERTKFF